MNYQETINYLYNQLPVYQNIGGEAYKEGLDNSLALDVLFGHPHKKYKTVHIGGTNGKGSTSHLLAAILQESGYKVGLYTSPHLIDFRERIRVNGEMIDKDYVIRFVDKHKSSFEPVYPSFFELTMMMAFCYFADKKVDVAIIEVGLGGRLDSTNIITPDLSVITNISLDHVQYLGNTLEKIAGEKAGIIKPHIPVVIGEGGTVRNVFEQKAQEVNAPICFAEDEKLIESYAKIDDKWVVETIDYPKLTSELGGYYQIKNIATVLTSVKVLKSSGYTIPDKAVYSGFSRVCELTGLMGRWQVLQEHPKVICDTGHNVGGMEYIVRQLADEEYNHLHMVIGVVNDKDISTILSLLPSGNDVTYYFTQAHIARALPAEELQNQAEKFGLKGSVFTSVPEAVKDARNNANEKDLIFVGGSNFIVGEALPLFNI